LFTRPRNRAPQSFSPLICFHSLYLHRTFSVLRRPTFIPFPEFAAKLIFGEFGDEILLGGQRAVPTKLIKSGFKFKYADIESAIRKQLE
jgi:uncharacterized protein